MARHIDDMAMTRSIRVRAGLFMILTDDAVDERDQMGRAEIRLCYLATPSSNLSVLAKIVGLGSAAGRAGQAGADRALPDDDDDGGRPAGPGLPPLGGLLTVHPRHRSVLSPMS
ncbi:hypothetical protein O7632_00820 [Solwaraspora sp. WMMD406]|uniref:hypothetical protein n=1 Tax=Solwaraspora sp. WMMD406 TaxID=3016095 RepID=UPI00241716C4|nr:hypothetical protein [Solwaraspora sp. WMMD406]MDG4762665.1 hypothetical protein [Solwaraspora sp. WMMD406]